MQQDYVNINKKAKRLQQDEEDRGGKKGKREKRREEWQDPKDFQKIEPPVPQNSTKPPLRKEISEEEKDRILMELCAILPHHDLADIYKELEARGYKMQETMNHMMQQDEKKRQKKEKKETKLDKEEMAHQLLSEVYDQFQQENISSEQFQQIFEEIAEMFKQKHLQAKEISNFEDQCNSFKQALIIGFQEELANYDDFELDLDSPLWLQTQEFKLKQREQNNKKEKDFPLPQSQAMHQDSTINKILKMQKRKKEQADFFCPPRNYLPLPQHAQLRNNKASIFNLDNKLETEMALTDLCRKFRNIPIPWLKFVYRQLQANFNDCSDFFYNYYGEMCKKEEEPRHRVVVCPPPPPSYFQRPAKVAVRKEEVDEEVRHMSLKEIRDQLDYLYKLRQTIQMMKGSVRGGQTQEFNRMIAQKAPRIAKLSRAARIREVERMAQGDPLYIDLHGYREQQIAPLFDGILRMLKDNKQSCRVNARPIGGKLTATFTAMTGKGLHSSNGRSILKPAIQHWASIRNLPAPIHQPDRLLLLITLQ